MILTCLSLRCDHPHVISGQGTMGLEIIDQVRNLDAVVLPVGGGGLLAGVALAVKTVYPHIKIIVRMPTLLYTFYSVNGLNPGVLVVC